MNALSSMSSTWITRSTNSIRHIQNLAYRWEVVWSLPLQYSQMPLPSGKFSNGARLEIQEASSVYNIFDDIALDAAVQGLWDLGGVADHDWIMDNAQTMESNYLDFGNLDWQLNGGD